jgi:hypothetical protein
MKKIKLNTIYAGPNGTGNPGQAITVQDDEATDLVAGRYAEYVKPEKEVPETASVATPETAAKPKGKGR